MKPYRHYPIFMLGYLFSISDAAVTITTTDSLNSAEYLECNSAVTLTCTTTPANPTTLIWEVNGVRASDCLLATCTNYGTYPANYAFTDDLSSGTFTLKMDPLIFTDDGTVISCTDGSDTVTFKPDVKVLAESGNTTISSTADSSGTNITIATGCVYPPEKITFTWNYVKSGKTAEAYTTTSPSAITTDGTGCSTGDCGGTGVEKVSQTLTIVEDTNGEEYSFQVVVNHADATGHDFTVTTIGTYKIAGPTTNTTTTTTPTTTTTTTTTPTTMTTTPTTMPTTPTTTTTTPTTTTITPTTMTTTPTTTTTTPTTMATTPTTTTTTPTTTATTPTTTTTTPTTTPATTSPDGNGSNETTLIIVLSTVGGLFVLGLAVAIGVMWRMKGRNLHSENHRHNEKHGKHTPHNTQYQVYPLQHNVSRINGSQYGYGQEGKIKLNPVYNRQTNVPAYHGHHHHHYYQDRAGKMEPYPYTPTMAADRYPAKMYLRAQPEARYYNGLYSLPTVHPGYTRAQYRSNEWPNNGSTLVRNRENFVVGDYSSNWL